MPNVDIRGYGKGNTRTSANAYGKPIHESPPAWSVMKVPGISVSLNRAARNTMMIANANPAHAPITSYFTSPSCRSFRGSRDSANVRFGSEADVLGPLRDVRFIPGSRHRLTQWACVAQVLAQQNTKAAEGFPVYYLKSVP